VFPLEHNTGRRAGSAWIAGEIESDIAGGRLGPGERLPTVRELAAALGVSPATVAAAYRDLGQRGLVSANRRRGTVVAGQPPLRLRGARPVPAGAVDLASGNPDPALLPPLGPVLAGLDPAHKLYGGPAKLPRLAALAQADFAADGIPAGDLAIAGGAMDGIERVLQAHLRPGDRVAVEDPGWPRIGDLVRALGLRPEPVAVDQAGPVPGELSGALARGARAVIVTPRGQNPTGAAVGPARGRELCEILGRQRHAVLIEDDYVAAVAGAPYVPLHTASDRWAVIRSLSKVLGPDLRVAPMAGDPLTISRVEGRQLLGPGWVSHLLQRAAAGLWDSPATRDLLPRTAARYAERRAALVDALAGHGITAHGRSGLGVWVPLAEEAPVVQQLAGQGWAVSPGERFRFRASPGIRITTTGLDPAAAVDLAAAIAGAATASPATYAG
jgi:DNA-binding transcriptional MocR family regulator